MPASFTLPRVVLALFVVVTAFSVRAGQPPPPVKPLEQTNDEPAAVAELFRDLAHPHDQVKLAGGDVVNIDPVGADTLLDPNFTGNIVTKTIADSQPLVLTSDGVAQYVPYERLALERIAEFGKAAADLPSLTRLTAAETALAATLRFSLGKRERPLKGTNRWADIQADLDRKLLDARVALLHERSTAPAFDKGLPYGDELVSLYPGNSTVLTEVARLHTRQAYLLLLARSPKSMPNYYPEIRRHLQWVDDHLPQPPFPAQTEADALRRILVGKAVTMLTAAQQAKDDKAALQLLKSAEEIWPRLPGLRDEVLRRQGKYAILYVGVRTLPKYFSPARAVTDSELQGLDLLFEVLLRPQHLSDGTIAYVPQLAMSLPKATDSERHFVLKKTAHWSNGAHVTAADVQKTFELLIDPKLPGGSGELNAQLDFVRMEGDAFHVEAKLRKGLLDPLAPFTFKVLPREFAGNPLTSADSEAFALAPVGSGPYMLAGKISEHGRTYVRFVVNPYHIGRHGSDGPIIREIRLFAANESVADLTHKIAPAQLLLDVTTADLPKLQKAGFKTISSPTRRVSFLAVNHRHGPLAEQSLRRAIAHALNRGQLLTDCFGGGQPLNGPFPMGSWAKCADERVPADLFDRASALAFLKAAKEESYDLTLKYPDDDPRVAQACTAIAAQLADLGDQANRPITLRLVPLSPHQLQRDLLTRNYQLAYWRHDFPNDAYSLWPLLDPSDEALATGSNYLGFKDDTWTELLYKAGSHRDFADVKRLTHDLHAAFHERMPLIPLWQLDYHIAYQPNLQLPPLDPLRIFANVDDWHWPGR
ncbi:MAG TPA: ABC transporter substrate-binding protein [Gemmataceae bacterium]|nr:ABC transporter substrate-binding protein [Gemmataceae bacterium]